MKTELKKNEQIIITTKRHWFTLVGPVLVTLIGSAIGLVAGGYFLLVAPILLCYLVYKVIERNNNIWVVTTLRVIDEFGVLSNNSKESPLDKINNVSYSQSFFGKIVGYGDVQIQTAAEVGSSTYHLVEKPKKLKDTITHMQEEYKQHQIKTQATELANAIAAGQPNHKTDIASELEKLYELKQKGILTEEEYTFRKTKILNS